MTQAAVKSGTQPCTRGAGQFLRSRSPAPSAVPAKPTEKTILRLPSRSISESRHVAHYHRDNIDGKGGKKAVRHREVADAHEQTGKPGHQAHDHVIAQEPVQPAQHGAPQIVGMKELGEPGRLRVRPCCHFRPAKDEACGRSAVFEAHDDRLGLLRASLADQPADRFREPRGAGEREEQRARRRWRRACASRPPDRAH